MSDDLIRFFESQIALENRIVQSVKDAVDDIDNFQPNKIHIVFEGAKLLSSLFTITRHSGPLTFPL